MKITTDSITTLPDKSVAAIVALLPANTLCRADTSPTDHRLDREQASAFVAECVRVSTGPIAFLLLREAKAWADVMRGQGLHVRRRSYLVDTFDLVVASAGPTKLPADDYATARETIEAITRCCSLPGDTVLVPFASTRLPPMSVKAAGRQVIAIAPSAPHAELLLAHVEGRNQSEPLSDGDYASAIARIAGGEGVSRIAQSLGVCVNRLNNRLIKDGHRSVTIRRPRSRKGK